MKKIFYILIPYILIGSLSISDSPSQTNLLKIDEENNQKNKSSEDQFENVKVDLKCKSCHISEYPTEKEPGLRECPRSKTVSVYHSPGEGPKVVFINEMSDKYSGVVFSHKVHAQMSEMSSGCSGCHHYNTTGPVLNCRHCHENKRSRKDVSVPDLKAAYHRQCLTCHKQWSNENGCNNQCHLSKNSNREETIESIKSKTHPELTEPVKITWETNSNINKTVTFYHDEHISLFMINCTNCHNQESCIKCHSHKIPEDFNKTIRIEKSSQAHHKPCINCHYGDSCEKCHNKNDLRFNHLRSSGWPLSGYHSSLSCEKCHGTSMPYEKLDKNCVSCHENFKTNFDHKLKGFIFSEAHSEIECEGCHSNKDFAKNPVCTDCHDDKSFPVDLPGKKLRRL